MPGGIEPSEHDEAAHPMVMCSIAVFPLMETSKLADCKAELGSEAGPSSASCRLYMPSSTTVHAWHDELVLSHESGKTPRALKTYIPCKLKWPPSQRIQFA